MGKYSDAHVCQCLSLLLTSRRNLSVTITNGRHKTGEQFVHEVVALAYGLQELGIKAGDVVAIAAYNRFVWLVLGWGGSQHKYIYIHTYIYILCYFRDLYLEWLLAIAFVGGIASPLNYRWSIQEAILAINSVRPVMLVTDESCCTWFKNIQKKDIPFLRWHVFIGSPSSDFSKKRDVLSPELLKKHLTKLPPFHFSWAPEGAVIICFTSGTTGKPKGVTLSHAALFMQSLAKIAIVGYTEDDIYLHTAPLCHIGGLSSAMAMLMVGGCHVLMPKFDAQSAVDAIEQYAVTSLITVPAIMADMVFSIRSKEAWKGGASVKKILNGGGSLSNELIVYSSIFFPKAKIISAYGMTETCSSLTFLTLYDSTQANVGQSSQVAGNRKRSDIIKYSQGVCVGKAAPHVELSICANASGHVGRILTRGPHVMIRYWDQTPTRPLDLDPSSNEVWLDTGDIGSIDHYGNLWLLGRTNGRIKSGGENIYPEEVEAILLEHSGIAGVVIVGIPDARLTEMVVACIQPRKDWQWSEQCVAESEDHHLSPENLRQYCLKKNLSRFKIPKMFILWRKPFPLTTTGKIRRDQLRKELIHQPHSLHSKI